MIKKTITSIFGLALLALLGWGAYKAFAFCAAYAKSLPEERLIFLGAGFAAFVVAPGIVAAAIRAGFRRLALKTGAQRKSALYEEIAGVCLASDIEKDAEFSRAQKKLEALKGSVSVIASGEVVQKYRLALEYSQENQDGSGAKAKVISELISAMRRDLGNEAWFGSLEF